jgi:uncharacterized protein YllA (UPF0747 family)
VRISPRRLPPAAPLFMDYLEDWQKVQTFYSQEYSLDSIAKFARGRQRPEQSRIDRLCAILSRQQQSFGAGQSSVEKLSAGAVAVVTGQQPGLFTGPHLSILKALSAVKIARNLEQFGINAVPVFWIAAEDHDYEEIESAWVLNRESGLCRAHVNLADEVPAPVGWLRFRADIRTVVNDCLSCLPQTDFTPDVREILETCYRPGMSPVESFGMMMAKLFADTPLIFVDPLDAEFKKLSEPILGEAVRCNAEIRAALIHRNRQLQDRNYHQQVKVDDNFTGLFAFRGRARQALKPGEVKSGLSFSPNALLRPVVQDSIFPTAAYVGGPAEIAYFAQASAIYETLRCPMPPIVPRISATILEPRIHRTMKKYGLDFPDAFLGRESLKAKCVSAIYDVEPFDRVSGRIDAEFQSLQGILNSMDATLLGALETSRRKAIYQANSLRKRYINAAARRDGVLERQLDAIGNALFPEKKLQERLLNVTSFLVHSGAGLIRRLDETLELDSRTHQIVEI